MMEINIYDGNEWFNAQRPLFIYRFGHRLDLTIYFHSLQIFSFDISLKT